MKDDASATDSNPAPALSPGTATEEDIPVAMLSAVPMGPQGVAPVARTGNPLLRSWRKIGGGSLALSLFIHIGIILAAGLVVLTTASQEKAVDFMPGGGSKQGAEASTALSHQVQQKRQKTLTKKVPRQRLVSTSLNSAISLPDTPPDLLSLPDVSSMLSSKVGAGMGLSGMGGGFGKGAGMGGMSGITFQPITMFGKEIKDARRIAVVMDVSRSMTKYLPAVVAELDKIARQSVLVMHFGCGLAKPKDKVDDKVRKADGPEFASFWQNYEGKAGLKLTAEERKALTYDPSKPMPLEDIYKRLAGRPNTHFINFGGVALTQAALMSTEVMEADIIYWFADFQDNVTEDMMNDVRRKLKYRKQKLYMHASAHGRSFDKVAEGLVKPLGGEIIDASAADKPKK